MRYNNEDCKPWGSQGKLAELLTARIASTRSSRWSISNFSEELASSLRWCRGYERVILESPVCERARETPSPCSFGSTTSLASFRYYQSARAVRFPRVRTRFSEVHERLLRTNDREVIGEVLSMRGTEKGSLFAGLVRSLLVAC